MKTFSAIATLSLAIGMMHTAAHAKEIRMAFGLALPPYVISESQSGFELEIIREALALRGHTLKPMFAPLARVPDLLRDKQADAAERGAPDLVEGQGFFYSTVPAVHYQDYAVSLKKTT
jgi:polar amino acid transport system substrate-binding protein